MTSPDWTGLTSLYDLKKCRWDSMEAAELCDAADDVISTENPFEERCSDFIEVANLITRLVALRYGFEFTSAPTRAAMSDVLATVPGITREALTELLDQAHRANYEGDDETPAFNLESIDIETHRLRSIVSEWFQSTPGPKLEHASIEWM